MFLTLKGKMKWFKKLIICFVMAADNNGLMLSLTCMQTVVQQAKHSNWSYFQTRNSYLDMYLSLTFKVQQIEGIHNFKRKRTLLQNIHCFKKMPIQFLVNFVFWRIWNTRDVANLTGTTTILFLNHIMYNSNSLQHS